MMNDGYALLRTIGGFSSSVDPDDPRYVKEYMAKHQHPPFPVSWRPYKQRGQTLDAYLAALRHFYTISNGMEILYVEVCKCVIYTVIPSDLLVFDMEDQIFDSKAFRKGKDCTLTDDQKEGLSGRDRDTVTGTIYPSKLDVKETTEGSNSSSYLDIMLSYDTDGHLNTSLYEKDEQDRYQFCGELRGADNKTLLVGGFEQIWNTIQVRLLLKTMSECYFKKRETIDKILQIQRMQKRFSEFSVADITEIETSLEKRNDELSPAFDNCLSQLNENELHEGFKKLYIGTWKLQVVFSENESKQIQKMEEISGKYREAFKASEDKNNIITRELKKLRENRSSLESKITELKERLKKDAEVQRKQNEQSQKKLKENKSEIADLERKIKLYHQKNFEIQENRATTETALSKLQDEYMKLKSNYDDALKRESQNETKMKNLESEISKNEHLMMLLEVEKTNMKTEIDQIKAKQENLLTRLSEVAGAKLTRGNTEITDLSDPNRPTKLGERFKEMYDNEWTEALEELTGQNVGVPDRAALDFLLDVMMKSFRFCSETLNKQASNCIRCFEEFPGPDSEDLKEDDSAPPLTVDLEENMKEDINCMRRKLLRKISSKARERYLAKIEIHLQRTVNQSSYPTSKTSENSMQIGKGTNGEVFTEIDTSKLERGGATTNLQENERSRECWQHETSGQNAELMDVDQENNASALQSSVSLSKSFQSRETNLNTIDAADVKSHVSGDNDVPMTDNLKNEKEDIVNVSEAGENQQGTSNDSRSTGVKDESTMGSQGDVSSNQTQYAGDVQTGSSGNKHPVQNEITRLGSQMGNESAPQDQKAKTSMIESCSRVYKYSYECFNLCWLMRKHSPGLHLDDQVEHGSEFDLNRFRHYTQTGKHVDYLVWPALYQHKGGPLIAKGVAQPVKEPVNRNKNNGTKKSCEENN